MVIATVDIQLYTATKSSSNYAIKVGEFYFMKV